MHAAARAGVQMSFQLAEHVRACRVEDCVVLLDIRADKYLAVPEPQSSYLSGVVRNWPSEISSGASRRNPSDVATDYDVTLKALLEAGMVSTSQAGESSVRLSLPCPNEELVTDHLVDARIHPGHMLRFAQSCITISALLYGRSLQATIEYCSSNRARLTKSSALDVPKARSLVSAFRALRPLFYTAKDRCLYDSLVLREFLRRYCLAPHVVFGVAIRPFRAHCWVQYEEFVFNNDPEIVREYTPILIV